MIISVGGGKGGTGKSFVATNLARIYEQMGRRVLLVDADVESPVDHILLGIDRKLSSEVTSFLPEIIPSKCTLCKECVKNCHEHALIQVEKHIPMVLPDLCDGCMVCKLVCPENAIVDAHKLIGRIYRGKKGNIDFIQGELLPNIKQSVNVIQKLLEIVKMSRDDYDVIIIDAPPGTGAALWSIMRYADVVIGVTEPTTLGASDLGRFLELVEGMVKKVVIVVNKAGMPGSSLEVLEGLLGSRIWIKIPYSEEIIRSYVSSRLVVDVLEDIRKIFLDLVGLIEKAFP